MLRRAPGPTASQFGIVDPSIGNGAEGVRSGCELVNKWPSATTPAYKTIRVFSTLNLFVYTSQK